MKPTEFPCPSCGVAQNLDQFDPVASPLALQYPYLGMTNVCKTCQLRYKKCSKCGVVKPSVARFWHKKKNGLHGFHSWCRECLNAQNIENHRARREQDNERMRKRYHSQKKS
jgi:hypothetical protein